jgi:hypothetical protein
MNDLKPIEAALGNTLYRQMARKLTGTPGYDEISNGGRRLGVMAKPGVGKTEPVGETE